ncbi:MAG: TonB-dependent receptor, partial [Vicinamibacterales bacterium]
MRGFTRRLIFVLAALLAAALPARAQSTAVNGTIEGTIKDVSGAVLPGVSVTVRNINTGDTRTVVTNEQGIYRAPLLSLGTYVAAAELTGFKKYEQTGIELTAGSTAVINIIMGVGTMTETVSVIADSSVVDLAKIDVGRNLNEREIKNLPLVSRNPYNFALLQPGVSGFENPEFGVPRFSANGSLLRINYQVDGNTNTQKDRAGLRLMPMSEVAIGEVKVVTSGYAPEFGQTMGLVYNAITPSGTNKLKGDVSFRYRDDNYSAFPFYFQGARTAARRPPDAAHTLTGNVGGPIMKDKLHYYLGAESTYRDLARVITVAPGVAEQVGLAAQPGAVPSNQTVRFYLGKVDYRLAAGHRLSARVNLFENDNPYNAGSGALVALERSGDFSDKMSSSAMQLVSNWGANRLNEFRAQYAQRHQQRFNHEGTPTGISINIAGAISFGAPVYNGEDFTQGITQVLDNYTLIRGKHSYKVGVDFQHVNDERGVALTSIYTFPNVAAYLAAKSGANPFGYTSFAQIIGNGRFEMATDLFSAFIQDDWRVADNLKVIYGLRYDVYKYPDANPDAPFAFNQSFAGDSNNFGPRAGLAWTIGPKRDRVVRASTGLMFDQPLLAIYEGSIQQNGLPARTTYNVTPAGLGAPAFPLTLSDLPVGFVRPTQSIFAPSPDLKTAYNWQNSLQYEMPFARQYHASVGLVYNRGYNLPVITEYNLRGITPLSLLADGRGVYGAARVDPRFNRINVVESPGESTYSAMLLTFGRRFANGVQFDLNYTLGKGEDNAPLTSVLAVQGDDFRSDPNDLERDKGPNALDTRHSFNGSIVAMSNVKFGPRLVQTLLSNNQVGMVIQFNSGVPTTIRGNRDLNNDGNNNDRPIG